MKYPELLDELIKLALKREREAEKIKKAEYMENKIGNEYNAIISSITKFGMFAQLENTVEGMIRFENMGEKEYFVYDESNKILVGERTGKIYKIGQKIKVEVIGANKLTRTVDFKLK